MAGDGARAAGGMWEGTASELQSLIEEMTGEVLELRKMVFWLGPNGRLFGKREDGRWAEYSLPEGTA